MKNKRRQLSRAHRSGAAVVETAILLPFLMIVTFGSIDLAQYINTAQVITSTSREGARVASRDTTKTVTEIETAIKKYLAETTPSLSPNDVVINVARVSTSDDGEMSQNQIPAGDLSKIDSGDPISVAVQINFSAVRWLPGIQYPPLETETICRRE